jgi:hypothetical protein
MATVVYGLAHPRYGALEVSLRWDNPFMGSCSVAASVTQVGSVAWSFQKQRYRRC